jgi:hypothetical protein
MITSTLQHITLNSGATDFAIEISDCFSFASLLFEDDHVLINT